MHSLFYLAEYSTAFAFPSGRRCAGSGPGETQSASISIHLFVLSPNVLKLQHEFACVFPSAQQVNGLNIVGQPLFFCKKKREKKVQKVSHWVLSIYLYDADKGGKMGVREGHGGIKTNLRGHLF